MAPVSTDDKRITYFAETDARGKKVRFGIKAEDRTRHVYVIGKTGMGKSTLLENMAAQDIQNGEGMCFIDPHGKTADLLLEYVPKDRIRDVIVIAPYDLENPISFNVLESVDHTKRHLVVGGLMSTFKKIWEDAWSARMEYILTNTLLALLEAPNSTLLGVNRMLSDKAYRNEIISHVTDPSVKSFWVKEFANYTERMAAEAVPAIQNKVGQFTANPLIRNMIGQPTSSFDFRKAMDERKIIIINLSKGRIGDENMKLLGGLLVTKIYLAAMSRADVPDRVMKMLPNFYLFVDEFQNFANASFADILSEARKYKLNLTIAHQYIEQMDEIVRPAVFGNVGTMIAFRVGATDAEVFEKEFAPVFLLEDLVNLGKYQLYLKLMIDGLSSSPFSATTLPPIPHPDTSYATEIIAASREQFSRPRAEVEAQVAQFHDSTPAMKKIEALGDREKPSPKIGSASLGALQKPKPVISTPVAISASIPVAPVPTASPISTTTSPSSAPTISPNVRKSITAVPIEKKVAVPISKPVVESKIVTPESPKEPVPTPIKPVSLAELAPKLQVPKQVPKQDPKMQSKENVNSLKNALAAAMAKKGGEAKSQMPLVQNTLSNRAIDPQPLKSLEKLKPVPRAENIEVAQSHNEVPEQVLKDVLKMD